MIKHKCICKILILLFVFPVMLFAETVGVFYDSSVEQIKFAAGDVKTALEGKGHTVEMLALSTLDAAYANKKVVIALTSDNATTSILTAQGGVLPSTLGEQAYALRTTSNPQTSYWVLGGDATGAMYGAFQVTENITFDGYTGTYNLQETPYVMNRGMKLNLPLDKRIPTYGGGWGSKSAQAAKSL